MKFPLKTGQIINVQAYKNNGKLYRQWNGVKVVEVSSETIVLFMYKTKVVEESNQKWIVREPILWFFPTNDWFNTTALIRKSGIFFYTNLASMPLFEDNTLKFIDYDLDIKDYPNQGIKVVDKNEFEKNAKLYKYSPKLIKKIELTTKQVIKYIKLNDGYFNEQIISQYLSQLIDKKHLSSKTKIKKT